MLAGTDGAARILLEARQFLGDAGTGIHDGVAASGEAGQVADGPLADGAFTMDEWREVLYKTATARLERQEEDGPPEPTTADSGIKSFILLQDIPSMAPRERREAARGAPRPARNGAKLDDPCT